MSEEQAAYLAGAIQQANDRLDWIEARQGPLPDDGYARIETSVGVVRALRGRETTMAGDEASDDPLAAARERGAWQLGRADGFRTWKLGTTHWGGCWTEHRACAVEKIEQLGARLDDIDPAPMRMQEAVQRADEAEAENARLRERVNALEVALYKRHRVSGAEVCRGCGWPKDGWPDGNGEHARRCWVRAALAGQPAAGGA